MIPLPCRFLIALAALVVPKSKRSDWKEEWKAELWHKAQAGADLQELLPCAWGAFRDAAWLCKNERKNDRKRRPFDLFRKPLRTEAAFLMGAVLVATLSGALRPPRLPYANAARLINVDHQTHFGGARDSRFRRKYIDLARSQTKTLEAMIVYRSEFGATPGMRVSRDFLPALGSQPLLGRPFNDRDTGNVAILSEDLWHTRFHSKPEIVGAAVSLNNNTYTVVGVMPRRFWFVSDAVRFYAPLDRSKQPVSFLGLLKPGETVSSAESELRRIAGQVEGLYVTEGLEAQPILQDPRPQELAFGAIVALIGALLGIGFLVIKRLGKPRYWLLLGARVGIVLFGLGLLRIWTLALSSPHGPGPYTSYSIIGVWIFLLICIAAECLLIIDHRGRCLMCFARLRMPAPIGVWSSQILDQPITEYVCPAGHGALVVAGTGNAPDHWTVLDETWRDLFAHTED